MEKFEGLSPSFFRAFLQNTVTFDSNFRIYAVIKAQRFAIEQYCTRTTPNSPRVRS